jgi:oligoendopeptidase F
MSRIPNPTRDEISEQHRWDLGDIYADAEAWELGFVELERRVEALAQRQGSLDSGGSALLDTLQERDALEALSHRVWWYASLMHDEDMRRNDNDERKQRVSLLLARASIATAWLRPEILALGEARVAEWIAASPDLAVYRFHLEDLFRQQDHVLDEPRERLLSYAAPLSNAPRDAYSMLSTADARWPTVEMTDGEEVKITYGAYHRILATAREQEDRRRAFDALYGLFGERGGPPHGRHPRFSGGEPDRDHARGHGATAPLLRAAPPDARSGPIPPL